MALINCPNCGNTVSDKAGICPHSGTLIEAKQDNGKGGGSVSKLASNERVKSFMLHNRRKLPKDKINEAGKRLLALNDKQWSAIEGVSLKNPTKLFWLSFFLGGFGVDRFLIRKPIYGFVKLYFTLLSLIGNILCYALELLEEDVNIFTSVLELVAFILWLIDLFRISKLTRRHNYECLMRTLGN